MLVKDTSKNTADYAVAEVWHFLKKQDRFETGFKIAFKNWSRNHVFIFMVENKRCYGISVEIFNC